MNNVKELQVQVNEDSKRVMYLAKEFLLNEETIDIVSGTAAAPNVARAAETLVKLKYVTYVSVNTDTSIVDNKRRTRFVVRVKKTNEFKKLYDENVENKKKAMEEREKLNNEKTTTK